MGITSLRDNIVQEAILLILEAIFEPLFISHVHGFRLGKGCHNALKEVQVTFSSVNWFIEGVHSLSFDTYDIPILVHLISNRINDKGFIDLLYKFFRTGSIVSPILYNILLYGLDEFMMNLRNIVDKGSKKVHVDNMGSRMNNDSSYSYKRLKYVRYADNFIIGIIGTREDCVNIRNQMHDFLLNVLKLNLNLDKMKITHARDKDKSAHFLGTEIKMTDLEKRTLRNVTRGDATLNTTSNTIPLLMVPTQKLIEKLIENKFAQAGGKPTRNVRCIHFENHQIVKHFYQL